MLYSESQKDNFLDAVASLKKYRRAELIDDKGNDLLSNLYTDLLPNEQILKTCLKGNTTFIVGRKGTGKSTLFLKIQQKLRKSNNSLSCYIDAKTIFESSKSEYINGFEELSKFVSLESLQNYLLERNFIQSILSELKKEIDTKSYNLVDKIKKLFGTDRSSIVREKLYNLQNSIENNEHLYSIEVPIFQQISTHIKNANEKTDESAFGKNSQVGGKAEIKDLGVNVSYSENNNLKKSQKNASEIEKQFSDIFLKVFQIKDTITKIKEILSLLEIQNLVVVIDDFSEIDDQAMQVLVDVILAPLNNWSDEFIKFKIAAYPNRVYYGKIDKSKVDIVDLDFYNLYSELDRNSMEERAIDFGSIHFWQKHSNSKQTIEVSTTNRKNLVDTLNIPLCARNFNPKANLFNCRLNRTRTNRTELFSLVIAIINNAGAMFFKIGNEVLSLFAPTMFK